MPTTLIFRNGPQKPPIIAGASVGNARDRYTWAQSRLNNRVVLQRGFDNPRVTALVQNFDPPRVLVVVTGMETWDIQSITIYREVDGIRYPLRGAEIVNVDGEDAFVRTDAEVPFGVPMTYVAVFATATATFEIRSNTVTAAATITPEQDTIISDAITGLAVKVSIKSWPEKEFPRETSVFNAGNRTIVVSGDRLSARSTMVINSFTDEQRKALETMLETATSGIVQIRQTSGLDDIDAYLALQGDVRSRPSRLAYHQHREWSLSVVEASPWPSAMEAVGYTLQDLSEYKSTLQDIADAWATLLDIATADLS